ncbi:MAG: flagellar basal body P-ring protein FlgI, partial [Burkholderiales bacterium]
NLAVEAPPASAKVILNARTGSIVMNQAVTVEPCAVAHGNLAIIVSAMPVISQPQPFGRGETVVAEQADIQIEQQDGKLMYLTGGTKLADVVKVLNTMGASPADLLAILQAMKAAGALRAELEVI